MRLLATLLAGLLVTAAFAQSSTAQRARATAPKDHKFAGRVVSVSTSSFTIKHGKKTLTVETANAQATQAKKPFDLSRLEVGEKVTVYGTASGTEVMAKRVMVAKSRPMKAKRSEPTKSKGSYSTGGGAFHGFGW